VITVFPYTAHAPVIEDETMITIGLRGPFRFGDGHRNLAALCLSCKQPVGGDPVMVITVVSVGSPACPTGCLSSDSYLIHHRCQPATVDERADLLVRGLTCDHPHPWS